MTIFKLKNLSISTINSSSQKPVNKTVLSAFNPNLIHADGIESFPHREGRKSKLR